MTRAFPRFLLLSLIVALLSGLVFTPGLPGAFVFDDLPNVVDNPSIQMQQLDAEGLARVVAGGQVSGVTRLLPTLTFALDFWRAGGMDPATFKTTNILIHVLTAGALAWFFLTLLQIAGVPAKRAKWAALALALAWAIHPLQVSSVLYVVQRLQTMGTFFLVLALLAYLAARRAQIAGQPGRTGLLGAGLLWVLAMSCKEDSALLPAYTLALELTVLRFAAANAGVARTLRRGYMLATVAGAAAYVLLVLPQHWHAGPYPGRDFSTGERLLTQARVLCLYLWQIVVPLPGHMPFYYDWLQPSRGLLQPWTTLPAVLAVAGLLGIAWRVRVRWPVFALGVFLFFAAHFVASNVIGLELAFEHRNHFALVGAVLALGSALGHLVQRMQLRAGVQATVCVALLASLASATLLRAHQWRGTLPLAQASTMAAPDSGRAWSSLCDGYFQAGGGVMRNNPLLDKAIDACAAGAASAPYSLSNPALLVALKTLRGDVTTQDWDLFQQRLATGHMSVDNRRIPFFLAQMARDGIKLDKQEMLEAFATLVKRTKVSAFNAASIGYFIMNDLGEQDLAIPYFMRSIEQSSPNDPFPRQLGAELRAMGRVDLALKVEQVGVTRSAVAGADRPTP